MFSRSSRERETHLAAGGRENIHGTSYPQALITLLFLRAIKLGQEFQIATEVKEAGKFDDIVICVIKDGKKFYRLIQIKYKLDPVKSKVTFHSLSSAKKNADMGLPIYFSSFRQIKNRFIRDGREISNLILYTNGDVKWDDKGNLGNHILKISDSFSCRSPNGIEEMDKFLETKLLYIKEDSKVRGIWKEFLMKNSEMNEDEEISEDADKFLQMICLAINQPGEKEINEMIYAELQFQGIVDTTQAYLHLNHYILDWMKEKQGYYLDKFDGLELIDLLMRLYGLVEFGVEGPVTNFVGRTEELLQIKAAYDQGNKKFVISGLGGIGKTQLAKKFLEQNRSNFNCIVWIKAEFKEDLIDSFRRLAFQKLNIIREGSDGKEKDFQVIMEEVNQWFQKRKTLIVLDNVMKIKNEESAANYLEYFVSSLTSVSFILMTSRVKYWDDIPVLHLNELSSKEAADMINISLKNLEKTDEEVESLTKVLQYYPLSLQQAVAYIHKNNEKVKIFGEKFGLSSYITIFNSNLNALLSHSTMKLNNDKYSETTMTTWEITMKDIKESGCALAEEVLQIISYFKSDAIDVDDVLECYERSLESAIKESIILLNEYSMISCNNGVIKVHRLVQRITRCKLKVEEEVIVLEKILKVLPNLSTNNQISIWEHAANHQDLVKKYANIPGMILQTLVEDIRYEEGHLFGKKSALLLEKFFHENDKVMVEFFTKLACVTYYNGKFSEALELYEELYSRLKNTQGTLYSSTTSTRRKISMILCEMGRYDEALTLMKKVFEDVRTVLPLEHRTTMSVICDMAYLLGKLAKHTDSLNELNKVHKVASNFLGNEHKETLIIRRSIAYTLLNSGYYSQSFKVYNDLLGKYEKVFGKQHPDVLNIKRNIAYTFGKLGKNIESLAMYKAVFYEMEFVLGKKHPDRLQTGCNIAHSLAELGRYEECLGVYKEVYYYSKEVLGEEHPITLNAGRCVSFALGKLGKNEESLNMYKNVYQLMNKILGEEHPDTLNIRRNIAFTLIELGKYDQALIIYDNVFKNFLKIYGSDHPDTLSTRCNIAFTLERLGRNSECLVIYKDVYKIMSRTLGENHPDSLNARCYIASILNKMGNFNESLEIYEEVYKKRMRIFGDNHPKTFNAGCNVASTFNEMGKIKESLEMYQKMYSIMQNVLGKNHLEVLHVRCGMAAAYGELGNYSKSLEVYEEVFEVTKKLFGEEHKENLKIKNNIALTLEKLGKNEESSVIFQEVYECKKKLLGNDHPETLSARGNTVKILLYLKKYDESLDIYNSIYDSLERVVGSEHPKTMNFRCKIAFTLNLSKRHHESLFLYKEIYKTMKRVLGEEHLMTLKAKSQMAHVFGEVEKFDESLIMYNQVYDCMVRKLGKHHPETLSTKGNIALILGRLRRYDESLKIYNEVYENMRIIHGSKHLNTIRMKENIAFINDKLKQISSNK